MPRATWPKVSIHFLARIIFLIWTYPPWGWIRTTFILLGKRHGAAYRCFGFMYRSLHITVDRGKTEEPFHIFKVEAGHWWQQEFGNLSRRWDYHKRVSRMARFKDGAFDWRWRKQIPIVLVTIATNWIILPDELTRLTWHPVRVIFHQPIEPDAERWDVQTLKDEVYRIIDTRTRATEKKFKTWHLMKKH